MNETAKLAHNANIRLMGWIQNLDAQLMAGTITLQQFHEEFNSAIAIHDERLFNLQTYIAPLGNE